MRKKITSKQALENFFDDIRQFEEHFIGCICPDSKEEYELIKKDLEMLEILKNNLYEEKGTGRFKGCNTINCSLGNQHSGIDYTKVKDWLENDWRRIRAVYWIYLI